MTCQPAPVAAALERLVSRLSEASKTRALSAKETLALRLNAQYPADVGVLSCFFLNFLALPRGEAIYLPANEPHAYVSGQLMEVMATSDNVVRAGLTPKLRDTQVLCDMLTYTQGPPEVLKGSPVDSAGRQRRYAPPFDEFQLEHVRLSAGEGVDTSFNEGPGILLVVAAGEGAAAEVVAGGAGLVAQGSVASAGLRRGDIYFVTAGARLRLAGGQGGMEVFYACCNDRVYA
jgi:mannose-6-phosphate isomerase